MTLKRSQLEARIKASDRKGQVERLSIPVVPTLIGTLAALNVASVVLVLLE